MKRIITISAMALAVLAGPALASSDDHDSDHSGSHEGYSYTSHESREHGGRRGGSDDGYRYRGHDSDDYYGRDGRYYDDDDRYEHRSGRRRYRD